MPELPEVETIRRGLVPRVVGQKVKTVELRLPRILEHGRPVDLEVLPGCELGALRRHGKYLFADFQDPSKTWTLMVHLGMTGQLTFHPQGAVPKDQFVRLLSGLMKPVGPHRIDKHTHLWIEFDSGDRLLFRDPRTFGKLRILSRSEMDQSPRVRKLGPDAWGLSKEGFLERFWARRGKRKVKVLLLDQTVLAGVGNIYADEACFRARVRPQVASQRLSKSRVLALGDAVQESLRIGLENCGTSFRDYVGADGVAGQNQEFLYVYGRAAEPCRDCETPLAKLQVAARTTVYCPRCQRP